MRWLAALMVFGLHVRVVEYFGAGPGRATVDVIFSAGAVGVSFFFILSGFVLAWSTRAGGRLGTFWRRRLARVYPLHLVTAVLAVVLILAALPSAELSTPQVVLNLLLLHSWNPDVHYSQSLNPVSWSLACEAFFYALFPLLMPAVRRLGARGLYAVGLLCVVAVVVVPLLVGDPAVHYVPAVRLPEFVLGIVLARLVILDRWRGPGLVAACGVLVVGAVAVTWAPAPLRFAACTVPGFALLIPAAAGADLRGRRNWLAHPVLVRLGEVSFAFYMIHILVMRTGEALFAVHPRLATLPAIGVTMAAFLVSLVLAWVLYEGVERPARAFLVRTRGGGLRRRARDGGLPRPARGGGIPRPRRPGSAVVDGPPYEITGTRRGTGSGGRD